MNEKEVGERIRNIRKKLNLKQGELGKVLNISDSTLSDIEKGKSRPTFDFLYNIVKLYNVNLYYILFGEGDMFLDPTISLFSRLAGFSANIEDVRSFLFYFERSPTIQYTTLTAFKAKLFREKDIIMSEVNEYEEKVKKEKREARNNGLSINKRRQKKDTIKERKRRK